MTKDIKICYKCKHHTGYGDEFSICHHPNNVPVAVNVVTGFHIKKFKNCAACRNSADGCAKEGFWYDSGNKFYEDPQSSPKPTQPSKKPSQWSVDDI